MKIIDKFIAQVVDLQLKKGKRLVLKLEASADMLPKAIRLTSFTGAGRPRPVILELWRKEEGKKNLAMIRFESQMWAFHVRHEGDLLIQFHCDGEMDKEFIWNSIDENVIVAYGEAGE